MQDFLMITLILFLKMVIQKKRKFIDTILNLIIIGVLKHVKQNKTIVK